MHLFKATLMIGMMLALVMIPTAEANHGITGVIKKDGVQIGRLEYVSGDGDTQTWTVYRGFIVSSRCEAVGSIENGLVSVDCSTPFHIHGTGHHHRWPYCATDVHTVTMEIGLAATGYLAQEQVELTIDSDC